MELIENPNNNTVEFWLNRPEVDNGLWGQQLKPLYKKYRDRGCLVAVFLSGQEDLQQSTCNLLRRNRDPQPIGDQYQ